MSSSPSSDQGAVPRPRQQPGSACEECRRRKLRCDRQQPRCGVCAETGVECHITPLRPPRGPKRGQFKALQNRVAALESRLTEQAINSIQSEALVAIQDTAEDPPSHPEKDFDTQPQQTLQESDGGTTGTRLPTWMKAELNQIYFDRVHPVVPMLHQRRYFTWTRVPGQSMARTCLQYTMWILAASCSRQFQSMLEVLDTKDNEVDGIDIEQVQAWILLVLYEVTNSHSRRGWISAGRAFRLVQLMRLFEIDGSDTMLAQSLTDDWVQLEEKRRTFWMAYLLDRFISVQNGLPLTLNEQVILTRLPAGDSEFQSVQRVQMRFLSEEITALDPTALSPFSECIILATICGRALLHKHCASVERVYGHVSQDFWDRHCWIDNILTQRIKILNLKYPPASQNIDPMLIFTELVANTAVLFLYKIIDTMPCHTLESSVKFMEYKQRAKKAADEIVNITRALSLFTQCKIHPFTPICLYICAEFFTFHREEDNSSYFDIQLKEITDALRNLQSVNNLARNFLLALESDGSTCTSRSLVIGSESLDLSQITSNPASIEIPPFAALETMEYSTPIDDRQIDFHWNMGQAGYGGF
ncbi:putative Transcription factor [Talaromyces atroroseus]|uniref:Putative Transcription factor n=1 Tax=Talaromyces atroroseus TaxID=1441469 RepID=A0A1Q5Q6M4_TALAT|nr:putative Transcription factor [Talaromyces atroroseus]OKL55498.1 putative Transcription factor [Talaromyces atroroseus]